MFENVHTPGEFATAVVNAARAKGYNAMIFVDGKKAYTGDLEAILYGTTKKPSTIPSTTKLHTTHTFKDLHDYIKEANVNESSGCYTPPEWLENGRKRYHMQIYSARNQVNILLGKDVLRAEPVADIVFDDDEVMLVRVDSVGRADYDHPVRLPITTGLDYDNWLGAFGSVGVTIRDLIIKLFPEDKAPEQEPKKKEYPLTFKGFREFCKMALTPGEMYTFLGPDGSRWGLKNSWTTPGDIYMYYIPQDGNTTPKFVAGFLFWDDVDGLHCRLVPNNTDGTPDYKAAEGHNHVVDGDTRIDVTETPFVTANSGWHIYFGGNVYGLKIRNALWCLLS